MFELIDKREKQNPGITKSIKQSRTKGGWEGDGVILGFFLYDKCVIINTSIIINMRHDSEHQPHMIQYNDIIRNKN